MSQAAQLNVIMVGPTRVGKTSLLVSMYDRFKEEVKKIGIDTSIADESERALLDAKQKLKAFASGGFISGNPGIEGDSDIRAYKFELDKSGSNDRLIDFTFIDVAGGFYKETSKKEILRGLVQKCQASIIAIDTPSLMEQEDESGIGKYFESTNHFEHILAFYEKAFKVIEEYEKNHIIIMVFVRAEKYLHNQQEDVIYAKAKIAYRALIEQAKKKNIQIFGCPVETVGSRIYSHNELGHEDYQPVFIKSPKISEFTPKHCAIPLRLVLRSCFSSIAQNFATAAQNLIPEEERITKEATNAASEAVRINAEKDRLAAEKIRLANEANKIQKDIGFVDEILNIFSWSDKHKKSEEIRQNITEKSSDLAAIQNTFNQINDNLNEKRNNLNQVKNSINQKLEKNKEFHDLENQVKEKLRENSEFFTQF